MAGKPSDEQLQSTCITDAGTPNFILSPSPFLIPQAPFSHGLYGENDDILVRWYPMRIRFGNAKRAMQVRDELRRQGVDNYLHLTEQMVMHDGELQYRLMPTLCNLIFVHAEKRSIKLLKHQNPVCSVIQFMTKPSDRWQGVNEIIHVPDRSMQNFIHAADLDDPHRQRIPLTYNDFLDKVGQRVRILRGPFCGIEGEVKRIHRNRIVVVLLREAKLAFGITQTPPQDLQLLD